MEIDREGYTLRDLTPADAPDLARHANDAEIAANLRDRFPHPYRLEHAEQFIAFIMDGGGELAWAIDCGGETVGVVGAVPGQDVYAGSWELGYWLSREHWGRGVATAVTGAVCRHLFLEHGARRIWAGVFAGNTASARVLEKVGFMREGTVRAHVIKNGVVKDEWLYGLVRDPVS